MFVRDWASEGVPIAEGVKPASGSAAGGQTVTIRGGYFVPSETTVTFGGVPATNVLVEPSGLSLTAVIPANTVGPAEIVVTTLRGSSTPLTGFTYTAAVPDGVECRAQRGDGGRGDDCGDHRHEFRRGADDGDRWRIGGDRRRGRE